MAENRELVIKEDVLFRAIRDYKSTSSSSVRQSQNGKICTAQHYYRPQENASHSVPKIISIGPLHHSKPELKPMEDLKHEYLNDLLNRRGEFEPSSDGKNDELLHRLLRAAREMEERARNCYELSNDISSDDFVNMMVIDGCFLIELFLKVSLYIPDILLFENQIPFFVLEEFYKVLKEFGVYYTSTVVKLAYNLCRLKYIWHKSFLGEHDYLKCGTECMKPEIPNLLHLYHTMIFNQNHQPPSSNPTRIIRKWTMALFSWLFEIVTYPMYFIHKFFFADIMYPRDLTSAMELEEAGVRLQGSSMTLWFDKGTLRIPALILNHQSVSILKNLEAFEFYNQNSVTAYFHEYKSILSALIQNRGDLKVMEKHHIIITSTSSGGDESFGLIRDLVEVEFKNPVSAHVDDLARLGWHCHLAIYLCLQKYCEKPHHRRRAKLMKDYFGNPWSILGVLVGAVLLLLTTLQTVFTVLSYYH